MSGMQRLNVLTTFLRFSFTKYETYDTIFKTLDSIRKKIEKLNTASDSTTFNKFSFENTDKGTLNHYNGYCDLVDKDTFKRFPTVTSFEPVQEQCKISDVNPDFPKSDPFVPDTQPSLGQQLNIDQLEPEARLELLKELVKNMTTSEITRGLMASLEQKEFSSLATELQTFSLDENHVICETDFEEMEKDSSGPPLIQATSALKCCPEISALKNACDPSRYLITCTRLPSKLQKQLGDFCDMFNVSRQNDINDNCTHLIMHTDDCCEITRDSYTFKYLYALSAKLFIASHTWICDSLKQGVLLREDSYEVKSDRIHGESLTPNLARMSPKHLFEDTCFLLLSEFHDFRLTKDQVASVLVAGKAIVRTSIDQLHELMSQYHNIIAVVSNDRQKLNPTILDSLDRHSIKVVECETLIESIFHYQPL